MIKKFVEINCMLFNVKLVFRILCDVTSTWINHGVTYLRSHIIVHLRFQVCLYTNLCPCTNVTIHLIFQIDTKWKMKKEEISKI